MQDREQHIADQIEKSMSLLSVHSNLAAPDGFLTRLERRPEFSTSRKSPWGEWAKIAAMVAFVVINASVLSSQSSSGQEEAEDVVDSFISGYQLSGDTYLWSYE